jgi:hypothetical protein
MLSLHKPAMGPLLPGADRLWRRSMTVIEKAGESLALQQERQLIERIVATTSFQRSARLRDLLIYLSERTLSGHGKELTELLIGKAVFGKPADFSPVEDSSVRVHVRQLRLKLHEYFDGEGRDEPLIIEVPRGSYVTVFRSATPRGAGLEVATPEPLLLPAIVSSAIVPGEPPLALRKRASLPWLLVAILFCCCLGLAWFAHTKRAQENDVPWPLSSVFESSHRTYIVLADSNYGMFRIIGQKSGSLEEYLQPQYPKQFLPSNENDSENRLHKYISDSILTSYADVAVSTMLMNRTHAFNGQTLVRSARNLQLRDMEQGNFVFLGSPSSNPWVSLYASKLNFREKDLSVGEAGKGFENINPLPGEQKIYTDTQTTGHSGGDYATIALLPGLNGVGQVLILQGLQQEGTEAAGELLGNPEKLRQLRKALGLPETNDKPVHFEALLRTSTLAGMPNATEVIAVRRLP